MLEWMDGFFFTPVAQLPGYRIIIQIFFSTLIISDFFMDTFRMWKKYTWFACIALLFPASALIVLA